MTIDFHCVHCQTLLRVDDSFAGKVVQCSQCSQTMTVPAAPAAPDPLGPADPLAPAGSAGMGSVKVNPYAKPAGGLHPGFQPSGTPSSGGGGADPGMRLVLPVGWSGWAIAAGYLGLFSLLICPAPISLFIGLIALNDIKKHPEKHGLGRAWFGVIAGGIGTALIALYLLVAIIGLIMSS